MSDVVSGAYTGFAEVYDRFMDNVPYAQWADYIRGVLSSHGIRGGLVLELGCGTGTLTELLAESGYDMIGVDLSPDMLNEAMKKRDVSGHDILYLCQDMRDFELYGTVRAVVCCCDSLNYITDTEELTRVFRLVNNYLDPGGIFLFDMNTERKYREMGQQTFAEDRENESFIWDNDYDEETRLNEYDLALFVRAGGETWHKYRETHLQRAFLPEEIRGAVEAAGLRLISMNDAYTDAPAGPGSERITVIAAEQGKEENNE